MWNLQQVLGIPFEIFRRDHRSSGWHLQAGKQTVQEVGKCICQINSSQISLRSYHWPGPVLSALHFCILLTYSICPTPLWGQCCYYASLTKRENWDAERIFKNCPQSSRAGKGRRLDSNSVRQSGSRTWFFCHYVSACVKLSLPGGHPLRIIGLEADGTTSSKIESHRLKWKHIKQTLFLIQLQLCCGCQVLLALWATEMSG